MTRHWLGCDSSATRTTAGRSHCQLCGVIVPTRAHPLPCRSTGLCTESTVKDTGCSSSDAQARCGTLVLTNRAAPHRANDRGQIKKREPLDG